MELYHIFRLWRTSLVSNGTPYHYPIKLSLPLSHQPQIISKCRITWSVWFQRYPPCRTGYNDNSAWKNLWLGEVGHVEGFIDGTSMRRYTKTVSTTSTLTKHGQPEYNTIELSCKSSKCRLGLLLKMQLSLPLDLLMYWIALPSQTPFQTFVTSKWKKVINYLAYLRPLQK